MHGARPSLLACRRTAHSCERFCWRCPSFLTKVDKESMFAVPEGGRVGVIGSGKGVTAAPERQKHLF